MSRKRAVEIAIAAALIAAATVAYATETITYSYDAKGRLVKVVHSGTINNNVITNYSFDPADNRGNVQVTGAP